MIRYNRRFGRAVHRSRVKAGLATAGVYDSQSSRFPQDRPVKQYNRPSEREAERLKKYGRKFDHGPNDRDIGFPTH